MSDGISYEDCIAELKNLYNDMFTGKLRNDTYIGDAHAHALQAVARHVAQEGDRWQHIFNMHALGVAPEVRGYQDGTCRSYHHTTEPHAPYALPTVQAVAGNLSYGPPRSLEERLARASLSGAEGQE